MRELPTQKAGARNTDQPVLRNYTVRTTDPDLTASFNELLTRFQAGGVKGLYHGKWRKLKGTDLVNAILWQELHDSSLPLLPTHPGEAMEEAFVYALQVVADGRVIDDYTDEDGEKVQGYFSDEAPIGA